jgi:hypothetical protein
VSSESRRFRRLSEDPPLWYGVSMLRRVFFALCASARIASLRPTRAMMRDCEIALDGQHR